MSLQDYIKSKVAEACRNTGLETINLNQSLDEMMMERKLGLGRGASKPKNAYKNPVASDGMLSSSGRSLTMESDRKYSDDVYKSLDEVVAERGIIKPPTGKGNANRDDVDLPITGRNARSRLGFLETEENKMVTLDDFDPMNNSLDAMIKAHGIGKDFATSSTANKKAGDAGNKKKRRFEDMLSTPDGEGVCISYELADEFGQGPAKRQHKWPKVLNPYRAVGYLSGIGMVVEMKIGKMVVVDEEEEMKQNRDHLWRCVVSCGDLEVKADSSRKVVAREMACHKFMKKLREEYPEVELPWSTLSGDLFIDPKVGKWVEDLALQKGLTLEFEKSMRTLDQEQRQSGDPSYVYVSTYLADGNAYQGNAIKQFKYIIGMACIYLIVGLQTI